MTRRMADSTNVLNLPGGFDLYAGYSDGRWPDAAAIKTRFGDKTVMRVTVFPSDNEGDCLDVESGDATPAQAPAWIVKRRAAGHGGPLVYCSWSALPSVQAAFKAAGVTPPGFWVAGYPSPDGDAIPAGTVGHQWIDHGPYDESIMVDYLPGIDPAPVPPPPTPPAKNSEDEVMITGLVPFSGSDHQVQRNASGIITHFWRGDGGTGWLNEHLPYPAGFTSNPLLYVDTVAGAQILVIECEDASSDESLMRNTQAPGQPWSGWVAKV